jgi:transposase
MQTTPQLPENVEELKALLTAQFAMLDTLKAERDAFQFEAQSLKASKRDDLAEIGRLGLLIDKLRRMLFGQKSEKLEHQIDQLCLELEELHINQGERQTRLETKIVQSHERKVPVRQSLPEHLPRETQEILPQEQSCPSCGTDVSEFTRLGEDVSETLEWVPAHFKVIRHVRPKLTCRCCETIVQAPAPSRPIHRSYAGPSLLSHVMVSKYLDHLPIYRQCQIYARQDVMLSDSTVGDWVGGVHELLDPLLTALRKHVFAAKKLHADDTPIRVLAPGTGKTKTARLWVYARDDRPAGGTNPPAVWFSYSPDRKGIHPETHLQNYEGILQADAYTGFNALYKSGKIVEAACWAHTRRKFYDIHVSGPTPITTHVLHVIGDLYEIEAQVRGKPPDDRRQTREEKSKPKVQELHQWLLDQLPTLSKKSVTADAIRYALNQWEALVRFLENGAIEIDNNAAERSLRSVAIGRKNYLFLGSDAGGDRAATLYSLLGTAKLNGINPEAYLTHVLTVIADHPVNQVSELLPWNVKL